MRALKCIGLLMCLQMGFAQDTDQFKFGLPTEEHRAFKTYAKDSTANAVVLYEWGKSSIEKGNGGLTFLFEEYVVRIKILKKSGSEHANVEIPLYTGNRFNDKLIEARAVAIDPETLQRTALKKNEVYTTAENDRWSVARFTVPNVQEGSIIDYYFKTRSAYFFNFTSWYFQEDIPKIYSEFNTSIPANYKYNIKLVGSLKLDDHQSKVKENCYQFSGVGYAGCAVEKYVMKDIPAFKEEEHMTSKENFISHIEYELKEVERFDGTKEKYSKTWDDVDREIKTDEEIGSESRREGYFKREVPSELLAGPNTLEKAKEIYYHLQKELVWNKRYNIFKDVNAKRAWQEKSGNIAELNLVLLNVLKAADFDAHFALLSTRDHGVPSKLFPVLTEFNYLVVWLEIDGKAFFLDITDKGLPFGTLPFKALNGYARIMDLKKGSFWKDIKVKEHSTHLTAINLDIDSEGKVSGKMRLSKSKYAAYDKRKTLNKIDIDGYLSKIEDDNPQLTIENYEHVDLDNREALLKETFHFVLEPTKPDVNTLFIFPFVTKTLEKNPFTLDERNYPVDFGYPNSYRQQISLNIDPQWEIAELPEEIGLRLPDNSAILLFKIQKTDHKVAMSYNLTIRKSTYTPAQYFELKQLFKKAIDLQNGKPIVLKKKHS
ncbi:hypothetical protein ACFQ1M_06380 [Sungkyunkwania multivorans]|uniref:DUF3857 domain-containing protein n=1 Tax=Sungkyunkwania multivorans TaxID=1173618 RepID=A0ABW3CYS3_9FLAO